MNGAKEPLWLALHMGFTGRACTQQHILEVPLPHILLEWTSPTICSEARAIIFQTWFLIGELPTRRKNRFKKTCPALAVSVWEHQPFFESEVISFSPVFCHHLGNMVKDAPPCEIFSAFMFKKKSPRFPHNMSYPESISKGLKYGLLFGTLWVAAAIFGPWNEAVQQKHFFPTARL